MTFWLELRLNVKANKFETYIAKKDAETDPLTYEQLMNKMKMEVSFHKFSVKKSNSINGFVRPLVRQAFFKNRKFKKI